MHGWQFQSSLALYFRKLGVRFIEIANILKFTPGTSEALSSDEAAVSVRD